MPCLASFFDAMSGVKKLTNFMHAITCPTSAHESSSVEWGSHLSLQFNKVLLGFSQLQGITAQPVGHLNLLAELVSEVGLAIQAYELK